MGKKKVMMGILAVVAVGAIAGLLFGTEKGSKLRKKLKKKGLETAEMVKGKMNKYAEQKFS